ncbi:hypothetical protein BJ944DRAFT_245505 [Cunninghamella echinulata]|nr:hypothetical protein BJ944DRAFT_245505 [Cunninghamella echinulata]
MDKSESSANESSFIPTANLIYNIVKYSCLIGVFFFIRHCINKTDSFEFRAIHGGKFYGSKGYDVGFFGDSVGSNKIMSELIISMDNIYNIRNTIEQPLIVDNNNITINTTDTIHPNELFQLPIQEGENKINPYEKKNQINKKNSKYLRAGAKDITDTALTTTYQYDPIAYPSLSLRFSGCSVKTRTNITFQSQDEKEHNNHQQDVVVKITTMDHAEENVDFVLKLASKEFSLHTAHYQCDYEKPRATLDAHINVQVIFPSSLKNYQGIGVYLSNGYVHFDESLKNIQFASISIKTSYGAIISDYLRTQKVIMAMYNGYVDGYFEVSESFGLGVYYGNIQPIIRCLSNNVHIASTSKHGSSTIYIDKDSFEGQIDIQSTLSLPLITTSDPSAFSQKTIESNNPTRLKAIYRSEDADGQIIINGGKNASLNFVELV